MKVFRYVLNKMDLAMLWLMMFGLTILFFIGVSSDIKRCNREAEMKRIERLHTTSTHSFFNIYYKDDQKVEEVECDECIYGQTDDKIYFVNNNGDTMKIVSKIEVEKVTTKDKNKAK